MFKISLAAARVNAGLSQKQAAEKIFVTEKTICNWEKGFTRISFAQLETLCRIYNFDSQHIQLPERKK